MLNNSTDAKNHARDLLRGLIQLNHLSISSVASQSGSSKSHLSYFVRGLPGGSLSVDRLILILDGLGWTSGRLSLGNVHHWRIFSEIEEFIGSVLKPKVWDAANVFFEDESGDSGVMILSIDNARVVLRRGLDRNDAETMERLLSRARDLDGSRPPIFKSNIFVCSEDLKEFTTGVVTKELFDQVARPGVSQSYTSLQRERG